MKISLNTFGGLFPKISPRLIPENGATIAEYCRLDSGQLGAFGTNLAAFDHNGAAFTVPLSTRTIYRHRNRDGSVRWLKWDEEVHPIPSPVREDAYDRLYWSGQNYPRYALGTEVGAAVAPGYVPSATRKLGIPEPATAPTAAKTAATGDGSAQLLNRSYVFTYVSGLGEEGPPSPASGIVSARQGDTVTVTFLDAMPGYIYNTGAQPARRRVYRTNIDGDFQFVADVLVSAPNYVDTKLDEALGEVLPTVEYDPPADDSAGIHPDGPLQMMTQLPNGIVAGYSGRTIFFSEAYLPHTFPRSYSLTTRYRITGIVSLSIGLFVLTEGKPALLTGSNPASMTLVEIDTVESCVSRRSIVDMGDMALFAGPDGLMAATEGGVRMVSAPLFSNRQWSALNPASIHGYRYDGRYLFFYDTGATKGGYMVDFTTERPQLVTLPFYALCGFFEPVGGDLYLAIDTGNGNARVMQFDAGPDARFDWQSRELRAEAALNPGCAIVDAESYKGFTDAQGDYLEFTLIGDGVVRHTERVRTDEMFRLPDGYRAREFRIRLRGAGLINAVHVADTPGELAR